MFQHNTPKHVKRRRYTASDEITSRHDDLKDPLKGERPPRNQSILTRGRQININITIKKMDKIKANMLTPIRTITGQRTITDMLWSPTGEQVSNEELKGTYDDI